MWQPILENSSSLNRISAARIGIITLHWKVRIWLTILLMVCLMIIKHKIPTNSRCLLQWVILDFPRANLRLVALQQSLQTMINRKVSYPGARSRLEKLSLQNKFNEWWTHRTIGVSERKQLTKCSMTLRTEFSLIHNT